MISVIVPVYNVEKYLDECIVSIVNQTYKEIEILLINDGSTDKSGDICHVWSMKDGRIRVIDKENEGQAACRNLGVREARGEYVTFVDADDWIYQDMLALLLISIEKNGANIAICDAEVELPDGKVSDFSLRDLAQECIIISHNKGIVLSVKYTMWAKLYRKDFLISHNIVEPSIRFEDFAVIPIIFALADKISCVNKKMYFYRYNELSTVRDLQYIDDRFKAMEFLVKSFKERNMFEEWKPVLQQIMLERAAVLMRQIYPILGKCYKNCYERYDALLQSNFQLSLSKINPRFSSYCRTGKLDTNIFGKYNLAVIGSYNLMIVAKMMMQIGTPDYLDNHYGFSNVISMMSDQIEGMRKLNLTHNSNFRQKHIVQDFTKNFSCKNKCEFNDIDYILIDFLEERFDTGKIKDSYFTVSDAFQDIADKVGVTYEILDGKNSHTVDLWEESCKRLIQLLDDYVGLGSVILVKNYLSEKIIDENGTIIFFDDIGQIKEMNLILKYKYDFFVQHAQGIIVVESIGDEYYYTDKNFKHGCFPWHLNNKEYCKIAGDLMELLRENTDSK